MSREPIVIIDDDIEDLELMREMTVELRFPSQVMVFNNPVAALEFLETSLIEPLFILCDINMPKLDGFQLRMKLLELESTIKEAPFLFLSTSKTEKEILIANELKADAYYQKAGTFKGMKEMLENIMSLLKITPTL